MRMTIDRLRNKGASMLEFALISSFMIYMIFAIFEFGRYMFVEHTIRYAAQEGARIALVGGTASAINTAITTAARLAINPDTLTSPTFSFYIYPVVATTVPPYADPSNWATTAYPSVNLGVGGNYRKLRIRYTYSFILPMIKPLFPSGLLLIDTSVIYRIETF